MLHIRKGLTLPFPCCILCSVIELQKLAKPATGGVPAGTPFFTTEEQRYAETVFVF